MSALFLAPHNDDEALFGSFLICEHKPEVIVCLRSDVQFARYGITAAQRIGESQDGLFELGVPSSQWEQWAFSDAGPDWDGLREDLALRAQRGYDVVFAPQPEPEGHEHHNRIGELARELWGEAVLPYLTYTRSGGRSRWGTEIVPEPEWVERKHRALACYRSQIAEPSCAPWFLGDLREYVA